MCALAAAHDTCAHPTAIVMGCAAPPSDQFRPVDAAHTVQAVGLNSNLIPLVDPGIHYPSLGNYLLSAYATVRVHPRRGQTGPVLATAERKALMILAALASRLNRSCATRAALSAIRSRKS